MEQEKEKNITDGETVENVDEQPQDEKATNNKEEDIAEDTGKAEKEETTQAEENTEAEEEPKEKDPLAEANEKIAEMKDKYLRSVAEFDNYRKRTMRERAELILNGSEKAVQAVLPVVDDMERALADKTDDPKVIKEGLELIHNKLMKALASLGVTPIDTKDADFDTDVHEAIAMVPGTDDEKKGKVLDCIQKGYKLNDKVIRHAKVAVGQ